MLPRLVFLGEAGKQQLAFTTFCFLKLCLLFEKEPPSQPLTLFCADCFPSLLDN
jgi:hypothetical protein